MNKPIRWNEEKNQLLILQRGLSFEAVLEKLERGEIIAKKLILIKRNTPTKRYLF